MKNVAIECVINNEKLDSELCTLPSFPPEDGTVNIEAYRN
jgi:hypothetical protein